MEMNCCIGRRNMGDCRGYWLPSANNYYQQQLLMPRIPLSAMVKAASASAFRVNENSTNSYLDSANAIAVNSSGRNQTGELDGRILTQTEQLTSTLQQQLSSFATNLEAKFLLLLKQKDKDLAEEKKGAMKLIAILKKALTEQQKWKKIAWKLSIMVSALKGTLEQVQKPGLSSIGETKREEEVASCFSSPINEEEDDDDGDEPSAKRRKGNSHGSSSLCQICSSSSACQLILPCRHLCLCKQCEVLQCRCPVCNRVKKEALEVLF